MTIREALRAATVRLEQADVPDADVDASYLLASVLKEDTLAMRINGHRELAAPQRAAFDALCDRRRRASRCNTSSAKRNLWG
ncbi:MAG: hypothetical protein ACLS7Z_00555 [Christensenellales bacterium]